MILNIKELYLVEKDSPDQASNGDIAVSISNIQEGVDGSAVFGLTSDFSEITINDGNTYIPSRSRTLDVRVLKPSSTTKTLSTNPTNDLQQIKNWASNLTDVYICALTLDGVIYFGDYSSSTGSVKIVFNEQLSDNDVFAFSCTKEAEIGFNSSTGLYEGGFFAGNNLLGGYEWGDANGDNVPNGFASSGFDTESFSNGVYNITETGSATLQRDILYPFKDDITGSINVTLNSGSATTLALTIQQISYNGTTLLSDSFDYTSDGRLSGTITSDNIGSGNILFRFRMTVVANASTLDIDLSYPAFRVDGKTTYTKL